MEKENKKHDRENLFTSVWLCYVIFMISLIWLSNSHDMSVSLKSNEAL